MPKAEKHEYTGDVRGRFTVVAERKLTREEVTEAINEIMPDNIGLYLDGEKKPPVQISLDLISDDVEVDDECFDEDEDLDDEEEEEEDEDPEDGSEET
jgi:hypothetical protein